MNHIVALSGGKDSTAMALRLAELNPSIEYRYVITPTGDELPEMIDHWRKLSERLMTPLTPVSCGVSLEGLIYKQSALPNWRHRWCTRMLKIEPYYAYIKTLAPAISYVGLRADEEQRSGMKFPDCDGISVRFPMREWGWTIDDVRQYLDRAQITIPRRTDCGSCFYQTLGEWWHLLADHPDRFLEYEKLEADISALRGKPTTFRSPGRDTWPAGLTDLRKEFESGRVPRGIAQRQQMCRVCSL